MATRTVYRATWKAAMANGATDVSAVELGAASDADFTAFATALDAAMAGTKTRVAKIVQTDKRGVDKAAGTDVSAYVVLVAGRKRSKMSLQSMVDATSGTEAAVQAALLGHVSVGRFGPACTAVFCNCQTKTY